MRNSPAKWADLVLMVAVMFGAIIRFAPTVLAGSPINDGGMFYTMMQELRASAFALPAFTSYNQLQIPFAYPPLSLYAGALLSTLGIPTMEVLRWLPALVSTLSIVAFWWMASLMLDPSKASVAAAVYALMPRTFSWYIMGGGLSRSFGIFFLLLTCASTWLLFKKPGWRRVLWTAVLGACAVMSHPETALHTVAGCGLIWLFNGRSRQGVRDAALTALGVIVISSAWWGAVLARHGFEPFRSAMSTGAHNVLFWIPWLTLDFAQEPFVTLLTVLGLLGLTVQVLRRQWFLPAWVFMPFVVEPRSAPAIAVLPLAILAGCGITEFVLPTLASIGGNAAELAQDWTAHLARSGAARTVLGVVLVYGFFAAFAYDLSLARLVISPENRSAMEWVRQNTPPDARFIVLSGSVDPFEDSSAEWFPVLAGRKSLSTLQGQEWLLGKSFMPFLDSLQGLQRCLGGAPACVESWAVAHGAAFEYVFVVSNSPESPPGSYPLAYQLQQDPRYRVVFENDQVLVFGSK